MLCTNKGWNSILRKPADCVPSVETNEQKRSKEFTVKYSGILTLLFPRKDGVLVPVRLSATAF